MDAGHEPLLDSKWAIPFVALLIILAITLVTLLRVGMVLSRRRASRKAIASTATGPALSDVPLTASLNAKQL